MVQIEGNYIRTEEKDYDKFLSALGVGFLLRKAATASTPSMTISKSGKATHQNIAINQPKSILDFHQGCAKPGFWTRNHNQWVLMGSFRTTKSKSSKSIAIISTIRNQGPVHVLLGFLGNGGVFGQNQNQRLYFKKFEIKIKTNMLK